MPQFYWNPPSSGGAAEQVTAFVTVTLGVPAVTKGNGILTVGSFATGEHDVTFFPAMPDANYVMAGSVHAFGASGHIMEDHDNPVRTTSGIRIYLQHAPTGGPIDPEHYSLIFFP